MRQLANRENLCYFNQTASRCRCSLSSSPADRTSPIMASGGPCGGKRWAYTSRARRPTIDTVRRQVPEQARIGRCPPRDVCAEQGHVIQCSGSDGPVMPSTLVILHLLYPRD